MASIPFANRSPLNRIDRDGERFLRVQVDRSIVVADTAFTGLYRPFADRGTFVDLRQVTLGEHPENTPSYTGTEILKARGRVAIGGIGCGTAHEVFSWRRKIVERTGCRPDDVMMVGVSRSDYSRESMDRETHRALRSTQAPLRYVIADAENMPEVETALLDVTLAYNALVHARRPDLWLREMMRITGPNGSVLFNSTIDQSKEDRPLTALLASVQAMGCTVLRNPITYGEPVGGPSSHDYTMLYRVDIPSTGNPLLAA